MSATISPRGCASVSVAQRGRSSTREAIVRFFGSAVLSFVVIAIAAGLQPAIARAAQTQWPQATSDQKANPDVTFGTLPNGMRYAIRHNDRPTGQVSMRLVIEAGSMQETKGQEGIAHLLEHMAFRGSAHVPDGEVVKTLERLGLRFGADTNAETGPATTIYRFDLPHSDAPSVDTGLTFLREIAGNLALSQSALDSERQVVLAEARQRETPDKEVYFAQLQAEFPGHPLTLPTIGQTVVVENATPAQLRAFYDAYYRPERAVLIVVGDIDAKAMEAKIASMFSDWQGRGPPGEDPPPYATSGRAQTAVVDVQPGSSQSGLSLVWIAPYTALDETRAGRVAEMVRSLANDALRLRIFELKKAAGDPFVAGGAGEFRFPDVAHGQSLGASGVRDLDVSVALLIEAKRQLLVGGLTQSELEYAVAQARVQLQGMAADPPSFALANQVAAEAASGELDLNKAQRLELFEEAVKGLTVARVTETLRAEFEGEGPIVFVVTDKSGPTAPTVAALLAKANAAPLAVYTPPPPKPWPYTNFGPAGSVAERHDLADLGVTFVRFANGVRLTVRPTKDTPGQFRASVRFGNGRQDQPRDRIDASDWSPVLLIMGGVASLTPSEIGWTLEGRSVSTFATEDDNAWSIATSPLRPPVATTDLDLEMQYMTAMLTAPGWRSDDWKTILASSAQQEGAAQAVPAGVFQRNIQALLHPGDERWVPNTTEMRATWTPEQTRAFIEPIMQRSQIDVIVVGDMTPEQAIAAVAKTFGALPPRQGVPEPAGARVETFPAPTTAPVALHYKGATADQAVADISWPTTDRYAGWDDIAPSVILADILKQRIIDQLRTAEGETYTANAGEDFSADYPGWGRISLLVVAKPQSIDHIYATIDAIAADLGSRPVSADELARAIRPEVAAASAAQQATGYWLALLAGAQTDSRRLDYIRQTLPRLSSVTAADVQRVAKRWLRPDRAFRVEVLPDPSSVAVVSSVTSVGNR
jgi:zinc protease